MSSILESIGALLQAIGQGTIRRGSDHVERWRRQQLRRAERGAFYTGLRTKRGVQARLDAFWRRGDCTVTEGRIRMGRIEIPVSALLGESRRPGGDRDRLHAEAETVIYTVRTETAEVEWLLLASCEDHALKALDRGGVE